MRLCIFPFCLVCLECPCQIIAMTVLIHAHSILPIDSHPSFLPSFSHASTLYTTHAIVPRLAVATFFRRPFLLPSDCAE